MHVFRPLSRRECSRALLSTAARDGRFDRRLARSDAQHPLPRANRRPRDVSTLQHRSLIVPVCGGPNLSGLVSISLMLWFRSDSANHGTIRSSCSSARSD